MSRGSVFDAFTLGVILFAFGVIIMIGGTILTSIQTATQNNTITFVDQAGKTNTIGVLNQTILTKGQSAFNEFDTMMAFIMIGLIATSVVLAFMIPTHPVLIVPSIFVLLIAVIIAAQLTNAYSLIAQQPVLSAQANNMPVTAQIMSNLPFIVLMAGAIICIAMFVNSRKNQGVAG